MFPPSPGTAAGNTGFTQRATRSAVSGIGFFPVFTQPRSSRGPNLPGAVELVKPARPVQPSNHGAAPPSPQPVLCVPHVLLLPAAPVMISEPKFASLRVKCLPARRGVRGRGCFWVPRQHLGKCPPSLGTGGCGWGSGVRVLRGTALGHQELSPRHWIILRVLLDLQVQKIIRVS